MGLVGRKLLLFFGDAVLFLVSLVFTLLLRYGLPLDPGLLLSHIVAFAGLWAIWLVVFYVVDMYDLSVPVFSTGFFSRFVLGCAVIFFVGIGFFYATSFTDLTPKTILFVYVLVFGFLAYVWRWIFARKLSRLSGWKIGLYLPSDEALPLARLIESYRHHGYSCVVFDQTPSMSEAFREAASCVQVMVVPRSFFSDPTHTSWLYEMLESGVIFLDLSEAYELFARAIPLSSIDEAWCVRYVSLSGRRLYDRAKRWMDVIVATLMLILSSPLWVCIAILVKMEDHEPIFYRQIRLGKNGKPFQIMKFRTMRTDAESAGAQWASRYDARVTQIGAFLRRTHLDELPQMLNILRGDISLVGPRPERPEFVEILQKEIPHYHIRHFVKPGFTGWAQIKFRYARSVLDSQKKFEYDLYYIKNRSFILDVLILLKTVQLVFRG